LDDSMTTCFPSTAHQNASGVRRLVAIAGLVLVSAMGSVDAKAGIIVVAFCETAYSPVSIEDASSLPPSSDEAERQADPLPLECHGDRLRPKNSTGATGRLPGSVSGATLAIAAGSAVLPDRVLVSRLMVQRPPAIGLPPVFDRLHPPRRRA
jgi:hypothetical protein